MYTRWIQLMSVKQTGRRAKGCLSEILDDLSAAQML